MHFYGIRGLGNQWFKSYLSARKQRVVLGEKESNLLDITCGVPQGSILGPFYLVIYLRFL